MSAIPQTFEAVPPGWVKEHQVSFELAPVQADDPVEVAWSIHERLHALALEALRELPVTALMPPLELRRVIQLVDERLGALGLKKR